VSLKKESAGQNTVWQGTSSFSNAVFNAFAFLLKKLSSMAHSSHILAF
jgi:hypothetical protein